MDIESQLDMGLDQIAASRGGGGKGGKGGGRGGKASSRAQSGRTARQNASAPYGGGGGGRGRGSGGKGKGGGGGGGGGGDRPPAFNGPQGCRVYVGNLSWDVAWQDLKDHMRQVGEVTFCDVMTEGGGRDGRSKGCG